MDDDFIRITATAGYNNIMQSLGTGVPNSIVTLPNGPNYCGGSATSPSFICPPQQDQAILGGQEGLEGSQPQL